MQLFQIFYDPAGAFASLKGKRWAWLIPTVLMIVISLVFVTLLLGKFSAADILEQQMAQSGREVPPEGLGAAVGFVTATWYIGAAVGTPIMILVLALVLFALVKGFSGETSYSNMLNAAAHSLFAWSIISTALTLIMLFTAPDLASFNLQNPVPLNAGYFFSPDDVGKPLYSILTGISLLAAYLIYMLALGASKLSERVTTGKVLWPLAGIYAVMVLIGAGFAAIF